MAGRIDGSGALSWSAGRADPSYSELRVQTDGEGTTGRRHAQCPAYDFSRQHSTQHMARWMGGFRGGAGSDMGFDRRISWNWKASMPNYHRRRRSKHCPRSPPLVFIAGLRRLQWQGPCMCQPGGLVMGKTKSKSSTHMVKSIPKFQYWSVRGCQCMAGATQIRRVLDVYARA